MGQKLTKVEVLKLYLMINGIFREEYSYPYKKDKFSLTPENYTEEKWEKYLNNLSVTLGLLVILKNHILNEKIQAIISLRWDELDYNVHGNILPEYTDIYKDLFWGNSPIRSVLSNQKILKVSEEDAKIIFFNSERDIYRFIEETIDIGMLYKKLLDFYQEVPDEIILNKDCCFIEKEFELRDYFFWENGKTKKEKKKR